MGMDNRRKERLIMTWKKLGIVFKPNSSIPWMNSHAQLPTPFCLEGTKYRIFFASRDIEQRSHIGYVDIDMMNPTVILKQSINPVLEPGPWGNFDQDGVFPSCIVQNQGKILLYYIGWTKGSVSPLFHSAIGLAISEDGGETFTKYSQAPIFDRSRFDPCLVTSPFVFQLKDHWEMLYVSGIKWDKDPEGSLRSYYHIKQASSQNGFDWNRNGKIAIDFNHQDERNIARTCVNKNNGIFEAWYCYHRENQPYKIGYAESLNGIDWIRKDEKVNIFSTTDCFDSDMMCYPFVFSSRGNKYMIYNGNQFGKQGFGIAIKT